MTTLLYKDEYYVGRVKAMKKIALRGKRGAGLYVLVDDADAEQAEAYKWYLSSNGYVTTCLHVSGNRKNRNQKNLSLHRLLTCAKKSEVVDHRNGDPLDNRRSNLRICTLAQNNSNVRGRVAMRESQYKGIRREGNSWCVRVRGNTYGYYDDEVIAAMAYDREARKVFGEFCRLNFPDILLSEAVQPKSPRNVGERTSNQTGVSLSRKRKAVNKWRAVYRKKHLGWFATEEEAIAAYKEAKNASSSDTPSEAGRGSARI